MAEHHVCPVWIGYVLASPVRKLVWENPDRILKPYVNEAMTVADIGCAMGFFSLPLARMVGSNGKVICVDIQERMIKSLEKRARKAGLSGRIQTIICNADSLGLDVIGEKIDFALAIAVVHEVPDTARFFSEVNEAMKPAGRLLMAEPKGRVSETDFERTVSIAKHNGFEVTDRPQIKRGRAVLLEKRSF
ncbi:MAG: class I SAM-dependent methyltransferase [Sedimentisphaerales bacterium]|nr:class I SAM-dependent methyltransferase [Sedimentisphaerales bacterium]